MFDISVSHRERIHTKIWVERMGDVAVHVCVLCVLISVSVWIQCLHTREVTVMWYYSVHSGLTISTAIYLLSFFHHRCKKIIIISVYLPLNINWMHVKNLIFCLLEKYYLKNVPLGSPENSKRFACWVIFHKRNMILILSKNKLDGSHQRQTG